jgi:hypothetical protein
MSFKVTCKNTLLSYQNRNTAAKVLVFRCMNCVLVYIFFCYITPIKFMYLDDIFHEEGEGIY